MENRRKGLYTAKACRFCLSQDEPLSSLFEKKQAPKNSVPLSLKILSSISVEVFPSEKMPPYICRRCSFFMDVVYNFKNICREADKSILDFVQTGSALEPITWPSSLEKLFRYGSKQAVDVSIVKVEGGATVEVSQSISDSEEDEENIYNVKIGDGSEDGASACVKVVTSKDAEKPPKEKKRDSDDVDIESSTAQNTRECWACDKCPCTYPLQQLLELHKMQKHPARDVACNMCDTKFFTKYELAEHQLRHIHEMPFECVVCGCRFKRHILLKRHEKVVHSDVQQHKCPQCPASFISQEEFDAHKMRHSRVERNYACNYCDKRFLDNSNLMKHLKIMHECKTLHACEYCPEQFTSIRQLTRHVRTHAGERPYPCRYCDKTFTKSHHYTRHFRLKHSDAPPRSSVDDYRCDQCSVAFQSQDELIYHSAIHATQNLTCPLCQEKFDDVDAVTSHIKSHVTGMEFMCDFCELVFTTKDKLDVHIDNVHEDEIGNADEMEQDDSSMEMDGDEDDDDDNPINVKDAGDHMLVEIKKPNEFLLSPLNRDLEDKLNNANSEDSEPETIIKVEPSQVPHYELPPAQLPTLTPAPAPAPAPAPVTTQEATKENSLSRTASILRKAEEIKRKSIQETPPQDKKEKSKVESSTGGASDKSLRLLEKELQELQRTNKREEITKTPVKALETLRSRGRAQIHTSTPKLRADEKKSTTTKSTPTEKKAPERRAVKENKKPEDSKEAKANNISAKEVKEEKETKTKEDKETKTKEEKETKSKEDKEIKTKEDKETKANVSKEESKEKSANKIGSNKGATEEPVRRSSRASKVKDYAKMVNNSPKPAEVTHSDDDTDDDDEEYIEEDKPECKPKGRRAAQKPAPKPPAAKTPAAAPPAAPVPAPTPAKKRGRPRKDATTAEVPAKVKKSDNDEKEDSKSDKMETEVAVNVNSSPQSKSEQESDTSQEKINTSQSTPTKAVNAEQKQNQLVQTPTGQTLKKVSMKALPPGVRPLPLPATARPVSNQPVTEMQIGKKMVKVQKIVMTKAEVEEMAKKGLVEMKDGTMVLKAGVKLPSDANAFKSTLVGEGEKKTPKESPSKAATPTPTRCDMDDA